MTPLVLVLFAVWVIEMAVSLFMFSRFLNSDRGRSTWASWLAFAVLVVVGAVGPGAALIWLVLKTLS